MPLFPTATPSAREGLPPGTEIPRLASRGARSQNDAVHDLEKVVLLPVLLVAFVALAVYYSVTTPVFETPDEVWHFAYVRQLAFGRALPVVDAEGREPYRHEGLQPPLYYLIGSLTIAWMDPRDVPLPTPNPYARIGDPRAASNDNRNAFLHSPVEQFPYRGTALAVHLLRLYSILLGAGTVLLTFLLAREIFPERRMIAWGAALFVALLPQFLFISAAVSNDNLATLLAVATLWQLARLVRLGMDDRRVILLGVTIGAALLTKLNTIALVPLAYLALAAAAFQVPPARAPRDWRYLASRGVLLATRGVLLAAIVGVVAGWWYLRNLQLYGDWTTFARLAVLVGERPRSMDLLRWATAEGEGLRLSTWGVWGWFNILAAPWFYQFYDALAAIGVVGLAVALVRRRNLSPALWILPAWCVLIFLALWDYASNIITSQGRLLFPALAAGAVLWSWGVLALVPARWQAWAVGVLGAVLALDAAMVPGWFIAPAYAPHVIAESAVPPGAASLGWRLDNGVEILASAVDRRVARPGDEVTVTLYERVPGGRPPGDALFIHVVNSAGVIIGQRDSLIASGNLPASDTPVVIAESFAVPIPIGAPAPDRWTVQMGMYNPATGRRAPVPGPDGNPRGDLTVLAQLIAEPAPASAWNLDFGGRVGLDGADIERTEVSPGGKLSVTLRWRAVPGGGDNYVFVHALGDNERQWAQADAPIGNATSTQINLVFDPQTPPGVYPLEVGVYPAPGGDRYALFDRRGQDMGDRLFLGPVRVTAP